MPKLLSILLPLATAVLSATSARARAADYFVFFGSHRSGPGVGFSISHFDSDTGKLSAPKFALQTPGPAYFVIHPDGRHIYSVNSLKPDGTLSAYAFDPIAAKLTLINTVPNRGGDPSFFYFDADARHVLIANYQSGSFAVFALQADGSIGNRTAFVQDTGHSIDPVRQTHAYAHSIRLDPTHRFALGCDLGLDKVFIFHYDNIEGTLTPNDPPFATVPGGLGPRHLTFHPNGHWAYLVTEMGGMVIQFDWNPQNGTLTQLQSISAVPADFKGTNGSAEIGVHPNGKFLYVTDRGPNCVAVFAIDPQTGNLTLIEHVPTQGKTPRNFAFDPTGNWLLVTNHDSDNAVVFRIDPDTGRLTQTGDPVSVTYPFCPRFLAAP